MRTSQIATAVAGLLLLWPACNARLATEPPPPDGTSGSEGEAEAEAEGEAPMCGVNDGSEELDLGSEARPSDYPAAANWYDTDPATFDPAEPCGTFVGETVELDGDQNAAGGPAAAFNGTCFGLVWGPILFRALNPVDDTMGDRVFLDADNWITSLSLEWGHDRYAVAGGVWRGAAAMSGHDWAKVAMLDREGAQLTEFSFIEQADEVDIARYAHGHGWVLGYFVKQPDSREIRVRWVDDEANVDAEDHLVGEGIVDGYGPRIVGLKSRASAVWARLDGVHYRNFRWPDVESARPEQLLMSVGPVLGSAVEAVAFRDYTAVAAMDGSHVHFAMIDPWEDVAVAGPNVVGLSAVGDRRPGLAPVDDRGYLGMCYAVGDGPAGGGGAHKDGVMFSIVGPDGTPWGAPMQVVGDLANIGGCAVSWSGEDFIVVWWEAALSNNRILARRIRPRT